MADVTGTQTARAVDDPGTRAKAIVYLWRTGNLDLLAVLGLAEDPAEVEKRRDRAVAAIHSGGNHHRRKLVSCPTCKRNMWQAWDGVCKRYDCAEVGELKRAGGAR